MTRFALDSIEPTPWKNGGGTTREVAVWPPDAGLDDFAWRISVADIAADGPFSAFAGIDRQIVLLDGAGVRLHAADGSFDYRLATIGEPFAFSGDVAVDATLIAGATRDFNVMARRGVCRAQVHAMQHGFSFSSGEDAVALFVLRGDWRDPGASLMEPLRANEGVWYPAGVTAAFHALVPLDADALCLCVTLTTESGQ